MPGPLARLVKGMLATITVLCAALCGRSAAAQLAIARPSFGVPAILEPGGVFAVEVRAPAGLATNGWSAWLTNDLRSWTCSVQAVEYGLFVDNLATNGYCLRVSPPADIAPEVFGLGIAHPDGGVATNRHCVSIVSRLETNFYILHYADPQAEVYTASTASGLYGSHGCIEELSWHVPVFSLIHPRFLFNTGDELDNNYVSWAHYQEYIDAMSRLTAPMLITRGNNDVTSGGSDWKAQIGVPTFSLAMGSFYVCMKDYNANDDYGWFTNDYAAACANTNFTFRLFGQHYPSGGYSYWPGAGHNPGLMLVGHAHDGGTLQTTPYPVLKTEHGCNYGTVAMFEFQKNGTNWLCPGATNHPAGTSFQTVGDWGRALLTNTWTLANDGTTGSNTATIANGISRNFADGRVRFLMRHAAVGYRVTGGRKLAEYAYLNGTRMAVVVQVDIAASATTTVRVVQLSTNLPELANDEGATDVTASSAQLNGSLLSTGASPTEVRLFWGPGDGGTTAAAWSSNVLVGAAVPCGAVAASISGLVSYTRYYYRAYATNAAGDGWAPASATFTTRDEAPPVVLIILPTNGPAWGSYVSNLVLAGTAADNAGITSVVYHLSGATTGAGQACTGAVTLIAAGSSWKYRDDGSNQGTAWRAPAFDDSSWSNGPAELGYGDGDESTIHSYGPDPNNKYPTTYYRHSFFIADLMNYTNLLDLQVRRDDGVAVYLNDHEVYRNNLAADCGYLAYASNACSDDGETWLPATIGSALLTQGWNMVAAEIHQSSATSSDTSFDLALCAPIGEGWLIPDLVLQGGTSLVAVVAFDIYGNSATDTLTVVVADDLDDDALPDDWELLHFSSLTNASGALGSDQDQDGQSDRHEYLAGTDPTNRLSLLQIESVPGMATSTAAVLCWPSVSGKFYSILKGTNLLSAFDAVVATNLAATPAMNFYTNTLDSAGANYYRIRLEH